MSGRNRVQAGTGQTMEQAVVEYLRADPAFFTRHPGLAASLRIPHACNGAVSLVEHQVERLRREAAERAGQLQRLVENARNNQELARRLHELVLDLLDTDRLDELMTTLYERLEAGFGGDLVALRIFCAPRAVENRGLAEFCPEHGGVPCALAALFERMQPSCGVAEREQLEVMFGERAGEVASVCMLPFVAARAPAVLAIGSRSARRFDPRMGTHYLRQLAEILGRLVGPKI